MMKDQNSRLVYTTDPERNKKCPRCKNLVEECVCVPEAPWEPASFTLHLSIEAEGRGGKIVTVISGFPKNESRLKRLTKLLKNRCGSGGTYRIAEETARIEIQGDKRSSIRPILEQEGLQVK
jgi:translation initiation factor 1